MEKAAQCALVESLFLSQLVMVLRSPDFRSACIQRLVAASIDPAEGERVLENVIDRVRAESRGRAPNLASRLLRALEDACASYAEMRGHPYKKIVGPLIRGWATFLSFAEQAGLSEEEGYAVIRDLLRKIPASRWGRDHEVDRELFEELQYGFSVLGIAKGRGPVHCPAQAAPAMRARRSSSLKSSRKGRRPRCSSSPRRCEPTA